MGAWICMVSVENDKENWATWLLFGRHGHRRHHRNVTQICRSCDLKILLTHAWDVAVNSCISFILVGVITQDKHSSQNCLICPKKGFQKCAKNEPMRNVLLKRTSACLIYFRLCHCKNQLWWDTFFTVPFSRTSTYIPHFVGASRPLCGLNNFISDVLQGIPI